MSALEQVQATAASSPLAGLPKDAAACERLLGTIREKLAGGGRRPRLLLLGHWSGRTGASGVYLDLVRALAPAFELHCLLPGEGPLAAPVRALAHDLAFLPAPWWLPHFPACLAGGLAGAVRMVLDRIRTAEIDLVISNTAVIAHGALAAAVAGKPHLWYLHELVHEDDDLLPRGIGVAQAHGGMLELASLAVTCSHHVRERIRDLVPGAAMEVLRPAVPPPAAPSPLADDDRFDLLFCGTLSRRKGCDIALGVIEHIARADSRFHMHFMGLDGRLGEQLRREIARRQLAGHAHVHGLLADPWAPPRARPILLHPARSEPFGLAVLEAALHGIPVVAAPCGGPQEILEGLPGCRIARGWSLAELTAEIRDLSGRYDQNRAALLDARATLAERHSPARFALAANLLVVEALQHPPARLARTGIVPFAEALSGAGERLLKAVAPGSDAATRRRQAMVWFVAQRLREMAKATARQPEELRLLLCGDMDGADGLRLQALGLRPESPAQRPEPGALDAIVCIARGGDERPSAAELAGWLRSGGRAYIEPGMDDAATGPGWTVLTCAAHGLQLLSYARQPEFAPLEFTKLGAGQAADLAPIR
ncbi:MAG: glycosyltransferase family 4 protein, partial [Alphaproteobacteria bacterium]|nr:glycosyltransferase family 4 protein [Alphaproteobacteria bacterium]